MDKYPKIRVTYECDAADDHTAAITNLTKTLTMIFNDPIDALHFISECTSCDSNIYELYPEYFAHVTNDEYVMINGKTLNLLELITDLEQFRINNLYN
tara:strand:+ start:1754 stop:2047 length:294 start_codon:yes stop_codon:yes gene_type:complete